MSDFIFQCKPTRYDLSKLQATPDRTEHWQATRYRRDMTPDDSVFFYMSGGNAGIYGCGRIVGPPDDQKESVPVKWSYLYPSIITRAELQAFLSENLLFTVRVGTNFLLSPTESQALRQLAKSKGFPVPKGGGKDGEQS